jgi:hypothetical protein
MATDKAKRSTEHPIDQPPDTDPQQGHEHPKAEPPATVQGSEPGLPQADLRKTGRQPPSSRSVASKKTSLFSRGSCLSAYSARSASPLVG